MTPGQQAEPRFLVIGRVVGAHGLRGELRVEIHTDFPEHFEVLETVYLGDDSTTGLGRGEPRHFHLERCRFHKGRAIVKLAGCETRSDAERLRGQWVQIPIEHARPLDEDEYYEYQIVGLEVWTDEGERLGRITEVLYTGSNDVYVVTGPEGEILIPALEDVVLQVDLEAGRIVVSLMEGLH